MAKESSAWSSSHLEAIRAIENELGREICGVLTDSGLPCKKWPVDKSHGRCSDHAPRQNNPADSRPVEVTSPSNQNSSSVNVTTKFDRIFHPVVISCLVAGGLLIGVLLTGGVFYYSGNFTPVISKSESSSRRKNDSAADEFTFERMNKLFEEGEYQVLERNLKKLTESKTPEKRERAFYYLFVLYQRTGREEKSLVAGEKFVDKFPKHTRSAEVLYSMVEIAARVLEDKETAKTYYQQLEREYSDSSWTEKAATFM